MSFWTNEKTAQLAAMLQNGWSMGKCAADLGCTRSAISGKIDRDGMRGNRPRATRRPLVALVRRDPRPSSGIVRRRVAMICEPLDIPFFERTSCQCSWPTGTGEDGRAVFCGLPVYANSWCEGHDRIGRRSAEKYENDKGTARFFTRHDNTIEAA